MVNAMANFKAGLALCGFLLACSCTGDVLRFPLGFERTEQTHHITTGGTQQPLIVFDSNSAAKSPASSGLSVHGGLTRNFTDLVYSAEISIGTPPQRFSLLVDISSPETFVTSINCRRCDTGDAKYDSSRSSSHKVNGTSLKVEYFHLSISGNMTIDTFGIFGCYLKNQPFLEASYVLSNGFLETDIINGIVGLTPSSAGSALNNPSPFMSLVKEKVLDKNILSMRLRKPRELIFGSIDHKLFTGKLVQIPLTNKTTGFALSGRWQAEARYLTLGSKPGKRMSLAGYTASFSTGSAYMWLPKPMAWDILTDLQFEDHNFLMPPSVPCERRKDMPDITFNLAGQNFTLTPYDYTFTYDFESVIVCASAILPIDVEQHEEIILGSAFLRPFYSVFDLDSNTVGFAALSTLP